MKQIKLVVALSLTLMLSACGYEMANYQWGNYQGALLDYYKSPDSLGELEQELAALVKNVDSETKLAPGLYAEYGFLLLKSGQGAEATKYFEMEKRDWPESEKLMNTMIKLAQVETPKKSAENTK